MPPSDVIVTLAVPAKPETILAPAALTVAAPIVTSPPVALKDTLALPENVDVVLAVIVVPL
jgi:hypothetical protein